MAHRTELAFRRAKPLDAAAIGEVVSLGLEDSPSALVGPAEVRADPTRLGQDILRTAARAGQRVYVTEALGHVVGVSRVIVREFARSRHVGMLWMMVVPPLRNRGIGRVLLAQSTAAAFEDEAFERLELSVSSSDGPFRHLLDEAGWIAERVELRALQDPEGFQDLMIYVRDRPI